jgi:hypothetical protein
MTFWALCGTGVVALLKAVHYLSRLTFFKGLKKRHQHSLQKWKQHRQEEAYTGKIWTLTFASLDLWQVYSGQKPGCLEMGKKGGRATSELKAKAAQENGKKGGRPRKLGSLCEC